MKNTVIYMALVASVLAFEVGAMKAITSQNTGETSTASDGDQIENKGQKPAKNFLS